MSLTDEQNLVIRQQALKIAREFFYITPADDLEAEFHLWAVEHPQRIARCTYDNDGEISFSWSQFRREVGAVMAAHARREKARAIGYNPEDEFFYPRAKVEDLLPYVWLDRSYIQDKAQGDKVTTANDPAKGGDRAAEIMDVRAAYHKAIRPRPEWDRVLLSIYGVGFTQEEVAEAEGVNQPAISKRQDRALDALVFELNGTEPEYDPPRGRKAMSNAAAQALRDRQEDGQ